MNDWRRYPGRLAHLITGDSRGITGLDSNGRGEVRIGTVWRSACGRELRLFWDERPWNAEWVGTFDLRAEVPRGWCLRCGYAAAIDALAIADWNFDVFKREVYAGRWPITIGAVA